MEAPLWKAAKLLAIGPRELAMILECDVTSVRKTLFEEIPGPVIRRCAILIFRGWIEKERQAGRGSPELDEAEGWIQYAEKHPPKPKRNKCIMPDDVRDRMDELIETLEKCA